MGLGVIYPGEDAAHGTVMLVSGSSMANGINADHVLLIFEGERNRGGSAEF